MSKEKDEEVEVDGVTYTAREWKSQLGGRYTTLYKDGEPEKTVPGTVRDLKETHGE